MLFLAVTAEESGLLGSEYYAEHPLVPLEKTAAVINIDALNPLGRARDLEVVGYRRLGPGGPSGRRREVEESHADTRTASRKRAGSTAPTSSISPRRACPRSTSSRARRCATRPTGAGKALLDDYDAKRYHKPGDEYSEDWDVSGSIEDLRLLFEVGARVANATTWPPGARATSSAPAREKSAKSREPAEEE